MEISFRLREYLYLYKREYTIFNKLCGTIALRRDEKVFDFFNHEPTKWCEQYDSAV